MINLWFKKISAIKKSRELLSRTNKILKKHGEFLNSEIAYEAAQKIRDCESAINQGGLKDIETAYFSLSKFTKKNLGIYEKSKLRQNLEVLIFALTLALLIRTFVVQPFKIPSGSMIPTLLIGDQLLVNKFVYGTKIPILGKTIFPLSEIQRGDVIVFKFPADRDSKVAGSGVHYIKRVIGVPGDIVDIKNRQIYINGKILKQEYVGNYEYLDDNIPRSADEYEQTFVSGTQSNVIYKNGLSSTTLGYTDFPVTVPEENLFVMGDNRDNSYDSRFWGFVPIKNVSGKAFLIHWSWDFKNSNILGKVRWSRIFSDIN